MNGILIVVCGSGMVRDAGDALLGLAANFMPMVAGHGVKSRAWVCCDA